MDQLQNDIDSLESERGELKTKLKETTKKVFIDSISRATPSQAASSAAAGPPSIGPYVPSPIKVRSLPTLFECYLNTHLGVLALLKNSPQICAIFRLQEKPLKKRKLTVLAKIVLKSISRKEYYILPKTTLKQIMVMAKKTLHFTFTELFS